MSTNDENTTPTTPLNSAPADETPVTHETAHEEARVSGESPSGHETVSGETPVADELPVSQGAAGSSHPRKPWTRRRKAVLATVVAIPLALGVGGSGVAAVVLATAVTSRLSSADTATGNSGSAGRFPGYPGGSGSSGGTTIPDFNGGQGGPSQGGGRGSGTESSAVAATDAQKVGVVTIVSTLNYDSSSQAAGTGMILSANGLVLTNNHVVAGSTSIKVTVESTNKTYTATVVGTDKTDDVAVIKLTDASGLTPVKFDTSGTVAVGDTVHSVGNASGTGNLVTATGTVTALNQAITVQSESSAAGESLKNLIEVSSDVVSGDSGGPLFDADGEVAGIITAASSGSSDITGYAIDIDVVLPIVKQIEAGKESATVMIGYPAFLGVQIANASTGTAGVPVGGAFAGMPAAKAGIVAGDTITAVNGSAVTSAEGLSSVISAKEPGDRVTVTWTTAAGVTQTATIVLGSGPAS